MSFEVSIASSSASPPSDPNPADIVCETSVEDASYADGIWTLRIKNVVTGKESVKTCNVFISCVGGLREPSYPAFASESKDFKGDVFHSARWDHSVDLKGKRLVLVGNGCSAAQIVSTPHLARALLSSSDVNDAMRCPTSSTTVLP